MPELRIQISNFQDQTEAIRTVRTEVFNVEQQIPIELEYDDADETCLHAVAWLGSSPVGTARLDLEQEGRIGRVAVLKAYRRQGIGSRLMEAFEQEARTRNLFKLWFHSQISAVPFYEALGYQTLGDEFLEADIRHVTMEKIF